jgi:hypothetical protein
MTDSAARLVIPEQLGPNVRPIVFVGSGDRFEAKDPPREALVNLALLAQSPVPVHVEFQTATGPLAYRILGATLDGRLVCERVSRQQRRKAERRGA